MVNRKPQGWDAFEDAIPFVRNLRGKTTPKSVKTSIKAGNKAGRTIRSTAKAGRNYAFGDPEKGWRNVASESAMWLVPYGKIGKGAKAIVRNRRVIGKAASGAAQTAAALSAKPAMDKALAATRRNKKVTRGATKKANVQRRAKSVKKGR